MDNQHTSKIPTLEQENRGVHPCGKCGWQYPNAHPSSKRRRAHNKVCGSIEGFKTVVDSGSAESSLHLSVADSGHFSDDDLKTPSPKIGKSTKTELGTSGGSTGGSDRSGYEVFLDADNYFSDTTRPSPGMEEHVAGLKVSVPDPGNFVKEDDVTLLPDKESKATVSTADPEDLRASLSRSIDTKDDVKGEVKSSEDTVLATSIGEKSLDVPGATLSHTAEEPAIESELHAAHALELTSGDAVEVHDIKVEGSSSRHMNSDDDIPEILVDGIKTHKALKDEDESSALKLKVMLVRKETMYLDATDEKLSLDDVVPENDKSLKASSIEEQASRDFINVDTDSLVSLSRNENQNPLKNEDESSEPMFELLTVKEEIGHLDATDETLTLDEAVPENDKSFKTSSIEEQASRDFLKINTDTDSLVSLLEADEEVTAEAFDTVKRENIAFDHHDKVERDATSMAGSHTEAQGTDADKMDAISTRLNEVSDSNLVGEDTSHFLETHSNTEAQGANADKMDTISTHLNEVSDSNIVGEDTSHFQETHSNSTVSYNEGSKENKTNAFTKAISPCEESSARISTDPNPNHSSGIELVERASKNQVLEEPLVSHVESPVTVEDERARVLKESSQEQGDESSSKQKLGVPALDVLVDSLSQTDSVDANWGSVSDATGLSTRSDALAIVDTEVLPSPGSQTSAVPQKANKLNMPDSFKTLTVEPSESAPETQSLQGRKKAEEVINKVNNWAAFKQWNPLKSFLGESNAETKQKTASKQKENSIPTTQNDIKPVTTVNAILGPEATDVEVMNAETSKEWNSPERYQIKREGRKAKGKPYWVPFVCCSSGH